MRFQQRKSDGRRTQRGSSNRAAFSLIEVVVALAIFSGACVGLTMTFINIMTAREHGVQNRLYDADLRAVRLQLLMQPDRELAEDGGELEVLSNGTAKWSAIIEPTNVVDLFKLQFEVEFSEPLDNAPPSYSETLYLLRPTWSESDERSDLLADKKEALLDSRDFSSF
ncbi:PulJ/GspJ family protein [Coraliomargarita akajimensis]|uniref:Prepilin-type N-terminal cleavage/methylation domain-containing protein n=1 Tax=Coraliomargarita akajimensis (strain DSM 45221 / IAM 15411 / JCM 23193 / KCTC 12865 / 04OKA010-24) TaxID=583355 RepID=D5EJQ7_CORAD|nr:prepilin-type N-terminal cleavage/methylation domain-containing protein [Coraliomargarita akajimensis]ADE54656.1 conserved hypothetical protein [Coraliomargarita akajimensis DSM 45221]